jgi:OmpA-OmpF porin, OOP family
MKLSRKGFNTLAAVAVIGIIAGVYSFRDLIPKANDKPAVVVEKTKTINFGGGTTPATETYSVSVPVAPSTTRGTCYVLETIPWNGMGAFIFANGGLKTQRGSLVDKYTNGGCIEIRLQNDYSQMQTHLATNQIAFYTIMGDGLPYVSLAQDSLLPGGFEAVGVVGFSDGEDKCIMTADVAAKKGRGALIAAVPLDGDWNICVKWAADNGTPINANGKTFDPNAMNFIDTATFQDANDKLVTHYCEERELIEGELAKNRKVIKCANGVGTWTPGDVDVVERYDGIVYADGKPVMKDNGQPEKIGLVSVASTRDYRGQMPTLIVGRKDFNQKHADLIVGLLKANDQAAVEINAGDLTSSGYQSNRALMEMGRLNAMVFQDKDADYWAKYFVGQAYSDELGTRMVLGGSRVIGLREAADYFGLRPGTRNTFKDVYEIFSGYDKVLRPDLTPRVIPYAEIVNTSYLQKALEGIQLNTGVTNEALAKPAQVSDVVSNKVWKIEFDSGKADIRSESFVTLMELAKQAGMTGLHIRIDGHTDNTGSAAINTKLSAARAAAVANWLSASSPAEFPASRFLVLGHGPATPICTDNTPECKQKNRRVEIGFYK